MDNKTTIIPIAGGKGGVGKSLLAANISIALAQQGHSTVVMDLDFGGSNLYSFLGLHNKNRGIGDYLNDKSIGFAELRVQTEWPQLDFIPGDGWTPFMANLGHAQKIKLLKNIKEISADYVVLDLGAGTTFNTLDFFRMTKKGLIITSPERVALMNMFVFLKNFIFRAIDRSIPKNGHIRALAKTFFEEAMTEEQATVHSLIDQIKAVDELTAKTIRDLCITYTPRIIFNQVHHPDKLHKLRSISQLAANVLSLKIDHFGAVFHDPVVLESIEKGVPLVKYNPNCPSARNINILAGRIAQMWEDNFENSAQKLSNNTGRLYEKLFPSHHSAPEEGAQPINQDQKEP